MEARRSEGNSGHTDLRESKDGPLPGLLLIMTSVTGIVDAVSYLALGHVFVANMTGNIVFLAFALAGTPGFSVGPATVALGAFVVGAYLGGLLASRMIDSRGRFLGDSALLQSVIFVGSVIIAAWAGRLLSGWNLYALIIALAVAMGLQNATVRDLGVADITTTVLTGTIVGIVADTGDPKGKWSRKRRRLLSVIAMALGAFVGSVVIVNSSALYPLLIALFVIVAIALTARRLSSTNPSWSRATK